MNVRGTLIDLGTRKGSTSTHAVVALTPEDARRLAENLFRPVFIAASEPASFRSWALGLLGDTPANKAASDEDLRRKIGQLLQAPLELVDGKPHTFVPTQEEADALGLDLAGEYSATLEARSYSVTGVFQVCDAAGRRVGGVQRTYPVTRPEVQQRIAAQIEEPRG